MTQHAEAVAGWKVATCRAGTGVEADTEKLDRLLHAGWEPFAVTSDARAGYVYHFRIPAQWSKDWEHTDATCRICGEPVEWDAEPVARHILADSLTGASQDDDHAPEHNDGGET